MPVKVEIKDNSRIVTKKLEGNIPAALNAMGTKAVNQILWQMRQGYGKPIRQTGDLQRDVSYEINEEARTVNVGNSLDYSVYVHEGTSKMKGRPYILSGITGEGHAAQLQKAAAEALAKGIT